MIAQRYHCETAGVCRMVDAWYYASRNGDSAVITLPDAPAIYLTHQPHEHVRWRTEGRKGLTIPLEDARERLAMVIGPQERFRSAVMFAQP